MHLIIGYINGLYCAIICDLLLYSFKYLYLLAASELLLYCRLLKVRSIGEGSTQVCNTFLKSF